MKITRRRSSLLVRERCVRAARLRKRALRGRHRADVAEIALRQRQLDHHRQAPCRRRPRSSRRASRRSGSSPSVEHTSGARKRAGVDAHVEDRERAVTACVALLVEVAHHRGDVRLEEAVAQHEDHEADVEEAEIAGDGGGECELADGHQQAADDHGLALAEVVVGEPAADQRREIHEAGEEPVELQRLRLRPAEAGVGRLDARDQRQHQQRAHAVVAEAFPHLGGEEQEQSFRMAEPGFPGDRGQGGAGHGFLLLLQVFARAPREARKSSKNKNGDIHLYRRQKTGTFTFSGGAFTLCKKSGTFTFSGRAFTLSSSTCTAGVWAKGECPAGKGECPHFLQRVNAPPEKVNVPVFCRR